LKSLHSKICGITNLTDAKAAVAAGADAIGLVFYASSPRAVSIPQAREIARNLGAFTVITGLFVDADPEFVQSVLVQVPLNLLQFHGSESRDYCESFQRPYMKAIRMKPELDVQAAIADYPTASAILLDAYRPGVPGGTGETFDWGRVPQSASRPLVLAGGSTPKNIADAVVATRAYGVDVSGGVESAPGLKDHEKIKSFIINAQLAAAQLDSKGD
jgi:phosphoribosylanthranilate isomerase